MTPRTIALLSDMQKQTAILAVTSLPLGQNVEIVIQATKKARTLDQNALMFAGVLKDISEQVWLNNRQYSVEVFHEYMKQQFLPDETEPYIFEHVKNADTYLKWDYKPDGERILIGSTTQLTKYGFSEYMTKIMAWGGEHGVLFTEVRR
jgi:hypothetical protein